MSTINYYNKIAEDLNLQYLSVSSEIVHKSWISDCLTDKKALQILDVGAGNGRDAGYFADLGHHVIAVEPADEMRKLGKSNTRGKSVYWINDMLPELNRVFKLESRYNIILLSAVWMHIPKTSRQRAVRKLSNLLKPGGKLIITLRHGPSPDHRVMYPVSIDELTGFARQYGLSLESHSSDEDGLSRDKVHWETVILKLPDDGSGAFPTIRNILINDNKSSTYKLALIRCLLRIADGSPGAVIRREDKRVILPIGLIALFWAKQYKPLLDHDIQQSSNASKGLGFVKNTGWNQLVHFTSMDFSVGNLFIDNDAKYLHATLKHISRLIKEMPVKYLTLPGTDNQYFEVELFKTPNNKKELFLDENTLCEYGEFSLPESLWNLMTQYACWIEPVCVSEWVHEMQKFKLNQAIGIQQLYELLNWSNPTRSTTLVRNRIEEVKQNSPVFCVWSELQIQYSYDVDHCLPFSRWPNNDLWNLLPASRSVNNKKRDLMPSARRLEQSRECIINWWEQAWSTNSLHSKRFYSQARLSLPGFKNDTNDTSALFEALKNQSHRVASLQSLNFWNG